MSKKTGEIVAEEKTAAAGQTETKQNEKAAEQPAKAGKADKAKKRVDKNKKPNLFVRMGRKLKEVFGELKKVSWPTFGKTVGQTGVVLVVVLFFTVIFGLVNAGFLELYRLLIDHFGGDSTALLSLLHIFGA